ncbi:uncharacterized protein CC84DRAFT_1160242 [Paraphaeosphaeria sporulosa]|uniref:Uncharacterized protein n=1 Tax=Paraphaeosphaeria sporulosa TaxID=1460663 RepID=A0A177D197_9PLEO|nr:uncharacterized protein CC84DRAFT_1160242 [Paraphaeosphaeria sporulosa]OAG12997.1 hypothetical protein CC84DRAFT_1160242 [Paraphaeosphaeria sporulosa]
MVWYLRGELEVKVLVCKVNRILLYTLLMPSAASLPPRFSAGSSASPDWGSSGTDRYYGERPLNSLACAERGWQGFHHPFDSTNRHASPWCLIWWFVPSLVNLVKGRA